MAMQTGFVRGGPVVLLRLEGAAIFVAAVLIYDHTGLSWWAFAALLLVPDASMLGYLVGPRIGAAAYNAAHTSITPLVILGAGLGLGMSLVVSIGAIWLAHVGMDRMLGYGLKYATSFADTHLGSLAKRAPVLEAAVPQSDALNNPAQ